MRRLDSVLFEAGDVSLVQHRVSAFSYGEKSSGHALACLRRLHLEVAILRAPLVQRDGVEMFLAEDTTYVSDHHLLQPFGVLGLAFRAG